MIPKNGLKILSIVVTTYMLLALIWWTILLFQSNQTVFEYKKELLQKEMNALYKIDNFEISEDPIFTRIESERTRKAKMILGEGIVFGLSLLIGIYLIQRSHYRELKATEQQSNFLLAITHELKSPLTSIKMGIQTLLKHDLDKETRDELLQDSIKESNRLEELINNLLLTSRINGGYNYQFDTHDLSEHLGNYIEYKQKTKLQIAFHSNEVSELIYDYNAFEIIFSNLIDNAEKYGATNLKIIIKDEGNKVVINFVDNGFGIPIKEKNNIFKKFYRLGSEETRKTKGTGLGLYIVREIVAGHNGQINVKNNKEKGCNFEITIPKKN